MSIVSTLFEENEMKGHKGIKPAHKDLAMGSKQTNKPKGNSGKTGFESSGSNNPGKISNNGGSRK